MRKATADHVALQISPDYPPSPLPLSDVLGLAPKYARVSAEAPQRHQAERDPARRR